MAKSWNFHHFYSMRRFHKLFNVKNFEENEEDKDLVRTKPMLRNIVRYLQANSSK